MKELFTAAEAATFLGKSVQAIRRMAKSGVLPGSRDSHRGYVFRRADLERIKIEEYPEGMSHNDIAKRYGKGRTAVIYHFKRLHAKPLGRNRSRTLATVYDPLTVERMARILGWEPVQNPTNESLALPSRAESEAG